MYTPHIYFCALIYMDLWRGKETKTGREKMERGTVIFTHYNIQNK